MSTSTRRQSQRVLPSERLTPRREHLLIDAMWESGGFEPLAMTVNEMAELAGVSAKSVDRAVPFLLHTGLLREEGKACVLTGLACELARLRVADTARARLLLHSHWRGYWFHELAREHLAPGPMEEKELAKRLTTGLSGPCERGLHLIEWMTYALLLDRDEEGRLILPAGQNPPPRTDETPHAGHFGVLDPLLAVPVEQITALPDQDFITLMAACSTVLTSLFSQSSRPTER